MINIKFLNSFLSNYWLNYTILFFFIITFLSLYPLPELPSEIGTDKFHHLIAYFFLSLGVSTIKPKNYKLILIFFISYGGFIEIIQPLVNRFGEISDFIYSTMGVLISLVIGNYINKFLNKI